MALGHGEGGEQNAPLGRAVIGGLLFGTVASLFVVPFMFSLLKPRPPAVAEIVSSSRRMKPARSLLFVLAVPVVALAADLQLVKPELAPPPPEPLRLPARTTPAEQAFVYSRATGTLAERRVDSGDLVKAGDILAVIAAPEVQRAAERAEAAVAQAAARAELARANLRRTRALDEKAVLSTAEARCRRSQCEDSRGRSHRGAGRCGPACVNSSRFSDSRAPSMV